MSAREWLRRRLADRWRRQRHNVAVAAALVPLLAVAWWAANAGWGSS